MSQFMFRRYTIRTYSKMIVSFILILFPRQAICEDINQTLYKEVFKYHGETANKGIFAQQVVDIIYNSFQQWYFTITFCDFTYFENRILKYTENYGNGYNVMLLNSCPYSNKSVVKPRYNKDGETAYLVTSNSLAVDASNSVIDAFKRTGIFKPRSAVIFVINTPIETDKYLYNALQNHFQLLWSRSITNSVLILKSDSLRMYTYNPFLKIVKDITSVKDVNNLLQNQYHNLYGYTLRLSVFKEVFLTDETDPVHCNSMLAKTVIKFFNASCLPLLPRDDSTVGDLLENGTATGVTNDLMDDYSDLELSSRILKTTYYGYIDTTYPFAQDELCFLIKSSGTKSTFNTTMKLISGQIGLLFFFTFIMFILITILIWNVETKSLNIKDKQTMGETVVDLIKCFIKQTINYTYRGEVYRFLIFLIVMYSLVVDCIIEGIITTAVIYPRYDPDINTLDELLESNLTFGVHNRDFNIFNQTFSYETYEKNKYRIELMRDKKLKEILDARNDQYALLFRRSKAVYISTKPSNIENRKPIYYVIPECPLPCFITYGLRYGSPYLPRLDFLLQQLIQGGIMQHWGFKPKLEVIKEYSKTLAAETKEKSTLSLKKLKIVFYVLLIGHAISTFVFFIELLYNKFTKKL